MSGFSTIRLDKSLPVARLTLARPERLNSFTREMLDEIASALEELRVTPGIRCLVISGEGRAFSAGQDLEERRTVAEGGRIDLEKTLASGLNRIIAALSEIPFPTVSSVGVVAAGAGASLALAADICIAADEAQFLMSFTNVGLGPDAGLSWVLPRLVGRADAMGKLMLGTGWSGSEAAAAGLIMRAVPAAVLATETDAIASGLAARATLALVATRRLINAAEGASLKEQLAAEAASQKALGDSGDYRAAVSAFLAKQKPSFNGR